MNKIYFLVISKLNKIIKSSCFNINSSLSSIFGLFLFINLSCIASSDYEYDINIDERISSLVSRPISWKTISIDYLEESLFLVYIIGKRRAKFKSKSRKKNFFLMLILDSENRTIKKFVQFNDNPGKFLGYSKANDRNYKSIFFLNKKNRFIISRARLSKDNNNYFLKYSSKKELKLDIKNPQGFIFLQKSNSIMFVGGIKGNKKIFQFYIDKEHMGGRKQGKKNQPIIRKTTNDIFLEDTLYYTANEDKNLLAEWKFNSIYIVYQVNFSNKNAIIDFNQLKFHHSDDLIDQALFNHEASQLLLRFDAQIIIYEINNLKAIENFENRTLCNFKNTVYNKFTQYHPEENLVLICCNPCTEEKCDNLCKISTCKLYNSTSCSFDYQDIIVEDKITDAIFDNNDQLIIAHGNKITLFRYKNNITNNTVAPTHTLTTRSTTDYRKFDLINNSITGITTPELTLAKTVINSIDPTAAGINKISKPHSNSASYNLNNYSIFLPVILLALFIKNKLSY